jgi:hypothetical protein
VVFTLLLPYDATQSGRTADSGKPATEDGGVAWQRLAAPPLALGPASDDPSPGHLVTCGGWKEPPITARSERIPARSDGDSSAAAGCGDGEQRVQEVCVGWVEEPVQEAARVLSYEQAASGCVSCLEEGEEELTFRPACKREGGNNLCGQLCCWPFGPGRGIERGTELLFF